MLALEFNSVLLSQAYSEECADCVTINISKVNRKSEDRVVVIDRSIIGILCVTEISEFNKLSSNVDVCARLVGESSDVTCGVVPVAPIRLPRSLRE